MKSIRARGARHSSVLFWVGIGALSLVLSRADDVCAATFDDLYTVSVEPDPALTGDRLRTDAIRRGMISLLTRITGRRRSAGEPGIADLIRDAPSYYNSYLPLAEEIRIGFLRTQVNEALARLNEPLWPEERPLTLLWLALDLGDGLRTELRGPAEASSYSPNRLEPQSSESLSEFSLGLFDAVADEFLSAADERGLPLVLPRLDDSDRRHVRYADVWGGFDRFVERAAEHYAVDAILIARVAMSETGPELRSIVRHGELLQSIDSGSLRSGIDWLADQYAAEFAFVGGTREALMTIHGIRRYADFGEVLSYLESVSIIDDVEFGSLSASGELLLRVRVRGDDAQLRQILALGGRLVVPEPAPPGQIPMSNNAGQLEFVPAWLADSQDTAGSP